LFVVRLLGGTLLPTSGIYFIIYISISYSPPANSA
jgi:hypothetical protein